MPQAYSHLVDILVDSDCILQLTYNLTMKLFVGSKLMHMPLVHRSNRL